MKTILIYFPVLFFLISSNSILAQDEFYKDKKEVEKISLKTDSVSYDNYSTAEDYYDAENNNRFYEKQEYAIDNIEGEDNQEEKRNKRERAAFISNVVFDVFVNAVFIFAAFLQ
ncbi:MAG: hypothetical protein AB7O47_05415 [Flavobacteriales bacterium]